MLVESVPNVSEGRRLDVVERLADALTSVPGVFLLDRTSDPSHNRSVFTVAGEHDAVSAGLERLVEQAVADIDMEQHTGEHPRIGAVDVIPFVPLGDTTMDACVDLARTFGARIASRHDIPVYLYARAATRADRVKLSDVRRGQYEGLKAEIAQNGRQPDFGPARMHPRFGAVAVGARPFLIAWNINLDSDDVELAKRIARRVRESGGGLPRLQGNGFRVEEPERGHPVRAQVSMNLLDFARDAAVAGLGGRRRAGGRGRRGAGRVGADRARPAGRAPRRGRSRRRAARRRRRGAPARGRGGHQAARLLAADGPRAAAGRGARRPGRDPG